MASPKGKVQCREGLGMCLPTNHQFIQKGMGKTWPCFGLVKGILMGVVQGEGGRLGGQALKLYQT